MMYRIVVKDGRRWTDLGEGPWRRFENALDYANAEVGLPWKIQKRSAGGRWSSVRGAAGDAGGRFRNAGGRRSKVSGKRGNVKKRRRNAGPRSVRKTMKRLKAGGYVPVKRHRYGPYYKGKPQRAKNAPARVKGRRVKGGRAVSLRNFTGTIVRKSDGTVNILGRGRRR